MAGIVGGRPATQTYFSGDGEPFGAPGAYGQPCDQGLPGVGYDFITVVAQKGQQGGQSCPMPLIPIALRDRLRAQATGRAAFSKAGGFTASNDRNTDLDIRRALFRLLVPIGWKHSSAERREIVALGGRTHGRHSWELLDTDGSRGGGDKRPWAIRTEAVLACADDGADQTSRCRGEESVLIIGEPKCDPTLYPVGEHAQRRGAV